MSAIWSIHDSLDLSAFYAPYEGDGRRNAPYEPSMMVKILIYAYATGVFSSRAVARKLEEDVAFRLCLRRGTFPSTARCVSFAAAMKRRAGNRSLIITVLCVGKCVKCGRGDSGARLPH